MTPRSSCPGGESTPLRGATSGSYYEINNVTETAVGISRGRHPERGYGLSYRPPGSFLESTVGSVLTRAEGNLRLHRCLRHLHPGSAGNDCGAICTSNRRPVRPHRTLQCGRSPDRRRTASGPRLGRGLAILPRRHPSTPKTKALPDCTDDRGAMRFSREPPVLSEIDPGWKRLP